MTRASRGFTLIELMVTLAVIVVLLLVALPSFQAVRQRAAVRAAAEQTLGFWNQARLEATKRNTWVKVGMLATTAASATSYCLGAATATSATDTAPCDCRAVPTTCDIARLGVDQSEWRDVTLLSSTLGGTTWPANAATAAVIEPKQGALAASGQKGLIGFTAPPGRRTYHLYVKVDQFGRGAVCQPSTDSAKLSDFSSRKC